ncbi:16703_t:CDS:2 [Acaulospora morrowiae]|uniref:16703_t:CDS:1 n=1 Tax=Acaulospora morrowiae TaxID=94023 RepID=A0A9N8VJN1_9GLOM|nr:16703_t:CDS:2 [Acaulospora morrowiae]
METKEHESFKESDSDDSENELDVRKNKHRLKPVDIQRQQLERLLQRVEKPVNIPEITDKPKLKAPKDIVRNVQGSSAGAGSGEFHVYRAHRRREYTRLKIMEEEAKKSQETKPNKSSFKIRTALNNRLFYLLNNGDQ